MTGPTGTQSPSLGMELVHPYCSTDPATALSKVNFQCKTKFEPMMMIWMGISSKGTSDNYVHKSKQAVNQETYLKECIDKRLLPQISFE